MPADLVTLADFKSFLGITDATQDTLLQTILDDLEAGLEEQCGRSAFPFAPAQSARLEVRDGNGSDTLYLYYPIADLTTIKLGADSADPDETLDPDDLDIVRWAVGSRRIVRVDGGCWGTKCDPRIVHITYDAQADLPSNCKLALKRVGALVYRQLGAEDAKSDSIAGFSRELKGLAAEDPIWHMAVGANRWIHL